MRYAERLAASGHDLPVIGEILADVDVFTTEERSLELIKGLDIAGRYGTGDIDDELWYKVALDEYRSGILGPACDTLYYYPRFAEMAAFPYTIEYSHITDGYYTREKNEDGTYVMGYEALESFCEEFLGAL